MRELDLKVQCPELLQQVPGFPNDGKGTALSDILFESECNQAALRETLGFAEGETTLEKESITDFESTFSFTKKIIMSMLGEEDAEYIGNNPNALWDNRLESGMKISKAITRRIADGSYLKPLSKILFNMDTREFDLKMRTELPKYPISNMSVFLLLKDPSVFIQNFFSEVAAAKGKSIGFTLDPLMFIRGTNSPNYTSCYKIERHYNSMSSISLGLSGRVGMIFSKDSASVLGRSWVVFSPTFDSFIVLKSYGFLPKETISTVCQWLCTLLNKDATWYSSDYTGFHLEADREEIGIYNDPIIRLYSSKLVKNAMNISFTVNTVVPKCILCGSRVESSTIICRSCERDRMSRCVNCGSIMIKDPEHSVQLCSKCLDKVEVCPTCGKAHKKGEKCNCINHSSTCSFCGKPATLNFNSVAMCTECAEAMLRTTCDACGAHGVMYPYKGKSLCPRCFGLITTGRVSSFNLKDEKTRQFLQNL